MMKTKNRFPQSRHRVLAAVLTVVTLSIVVSACPGRREQRAIKAGYLPIYADMPIFVAKQQHLFEKHGLNVEMIRFESSPDIGAALLNDSLEAGASVSATVLMSLESRDAGRLRVYVVDAPNKTNYLSSIVVLKSSGITSLAQLKNKKIGSFPGPGAGTFGKMVLESVGLKYPADYEWIELAAPSHLSALETKTIDALLTYEPVATQAVLEKGAVRLAPGAIENHVINPWQAGMWVLTRKFSTEDPDRAKKFVRAINEAIDFMRKDPAEAKKALTSFTSIKPEVAQAAVDSPFTKLGEVDIDTLQRNADILTDRKVLSKKIDVSKMMLPTSFLN